MTVARVAAGLGCDRGTPLDTVQAALEQALQQAGLEASQLVMLATVEAKADEPAFHALAAALGLPLRFYAAAELARVPVPNPSAAVMRHMGTPSVSEAAALLAAQASSPDALLAGKHKLRGPCGRHATVSLARLPADIGPHPSSIQKESP